MQRSFLQEKSLNRSQDNAEKSLNVDLSAKSRLLPYSTASGMLGLFDLYKEERDVCESYRMIFTVNPVCTNVLYNAVTEPVYKEGSYSAITLIESAETPVLKTNSDIFPYGTFNKSADTNNRLIVDQIGAVRDTEYSHEKIGDFKYHCGYDFFNNHLLRTSDFEHVRLEGSSDPKNKKEFNTIFDFAIDYSGNVVTRVIDEASGPVGENLNRQEIRMYQLDNIRTMNTAFYDELRSVDGWYGFYNTGYINIPNGKIFGTEKGEEDICINRILNNEVPCGFIDLYPDRTLYSFIPKVNRFKKRLERNWDCTIVYPFKSDYDMFNKINKNLANAVRVINTKIVYNNVGDELVQMHSLLRHTLEPGDTVRLFYRDYNGETVEAEVNRYSVPVMVTSIGDTEGNDENHYFTIKMSDIDTFCGVFEDETGKKNVGLKNKDGDVDSLAYFFYRKIENGFDNKYYFRKFKELQNYELVSISQEDIPSGAEVVKVLKEPTVVNSETPDYMQIGDEYIKKLTRPLTYTQNKLAFGENIYGDRVAQVIFNDDICVTGLLDNLGRPLSEVYFMAVKTNRGHKEWYEGTEETGNVPDATVDEVEFSHCFGELTSGLDLPMDEESTEYNVRKLYNVFAEDGDYNQDYKNGLLLALNDAPKGSYNGTPLPLESGITLSSYDEFYGDIVEYSKIRFAETQLEKVFYRFNTAQRELLKNDKYFDIHYDNLVGDLYDVESEEPGPGPGPTPTPTLTINGSTSYSDPNNFPVDGGRKTYTVEANYIITGTVNVLSRNIATSATVNSGVLTVGLDRNTTTSTRNWNVVVTGRSEGGETLTANASGMQNAATPELFFKWGNGQSSDTSGATSAATSIVGSYSTNISGVKFDVSGASGINIVNTGETSVTVEITSQAYDAPARTTYICAYTGSSLSNNNKVGVWTINQDAGGSTPTETTTVHIIIVSGKPADTIVVTINGVTNTYYNKTTLDITDVPLNAAFSCAADRAGYIGDTAATRTITGETTIELALLAYVLVCNDTGYKLYGNFGINGGSNGFYSDADAYSTKKAIINTISIDTPSTFSVTEFAGVFQNAPTNLIARISDDNNRSFSATNPDGSGWRGNASMNYLTIDPGDTITLTLGLN